ncbi:MAG: BlaI/MecI/CopY family transcriptional regulator [Acidimicrobiales bacterium]
MTNATTTCTNPRCTCQPCTCSDCRCGSARLGDLERQVMEVLWAASGAALRGRAVADRLPDYAYTTIATVLDRLSRKGQVHRVTEGHAHLYSATGTAGTHAAKAMREALEATTDPADALAQFVYDMPGGQLESLRRALRRRR